MVYRRVHNKNNRGALDLRALRVREYEPKQGMFSCLWCAHSYEKLLLTLLLLKGYRRNLRLEGKKTFNEVLAEKTIVRGG